MCLGLGGGFRDEDREEFVQFVAGIEGMAERTTGGDGVAVAPSGTGSGDIAGLHKVSSYLLRSTLRNAHPGGDVAHPDLRIAGDSEQDVGMVGEERPLRLGGGPGGCP